jgi:hypothetical protein
MMPLLRSRISARQSASNTPRCSHLRGATITPTVQTNGLNTAVWARERMVCAAGAFKDHVKLNFFKGAFLKDPLAKPKPPLSPPLGCRRRARSLTFGVDERQSRNFTGRKNLIR